MARFDCIENNNFSAATSFFLTYYYSTCAGSRPPCTPHTILQKSLGVEIKSLPRVLHHHASEHRDNNSVIGPDNMLKQQKNELNS